MYTFPKPSGEKIREIVSPDGLFGQVGRKRCSVLSIGEICSTRLLDIKVGLWCRQEVFSKEFGFQSNNSIGPRIIRSSENNMYKVISLLALALRYTSFVFDGSAVHR